MKKMTALSIIASAISIAALSGCQSFSSSQLSTVTQGLYSAASSTNITNEVQCPPLPVFEAGVSESETQIGNFYLCWEKENTSDRFFVQKDFKLASTAENSMLCAFEIKETIKGWPILTGREDCSERQQGRIYWDLSPGSWLIIEHQKRTQMDQCLKSQNPFECPDFSWGKIPMSKSPQV